LLVFTSFSWLETYGGQFSESWVSISSFVKSIHFLSLSNYNYGTFNIRFYKKHLEFSILKAIIMLPL
ncbi:MAG: hypothetical protein V3S17_06580, partial [candidate division Zixibacteria bacterium]